MKKSLFITSLIAICMGFVSCGGNSKSADNSESQPIATVTVDEVLANPDSLVAARVTALCSDAKLIP